MLSATLEIIGGEGKLDNKGLRITHLLIILQTPPKFYHPWTGGEDSDICDISLEYLRHYIVNWWPESLKRIREASPGGHMVRTLT